MTEVLFRLPKPHPKQLLAFESEATEILYGGATRGGKSFFTRWSLARWCTEIPGLQCDIFRLNYDDVIKNHMQGDFSFPIILASLIQAGLVTKTERELVWWHGSRITLEHANDDSVLSKHQGIPKHVRVFEEAAQIKERYLKWLSGWVTMTPQFAATLPPQYQNKFPKIIYTSNPIGISAPYLRREFVKARPREAIEKVGAFKRQYIEALVEDNPSEDAQATKARINQAMDAATADAMLTANWDAPVGDFVREFRESVDGKPYNVVPDFIPPEHWFKYRAFDWGHSEPFCVLWFCVSDGEIFQDHTGTDRWFRRGCKIVYREWYGCNPAKPAEGLGMLNKEIAQGIRQRTPETTTNLTLTDNLPFQSRGGILIATEFAQEGIPLTLGNTARIPGWKRVKDDFKGLDGYPMLVVTESCKYLRDYIPQLQRHATKSEDAVESGEATHATDTLRLGSLATPTPTQKAPTSEDIMRHLVKRPNMQDIMRIRVTGGHREY